MKIGVIGLGLIGGSLAKALAAYTEHSAYGADTNPAVVERAIREGAVSGAMTRENCPDMEVILVSTYPGAAVRAVEEWADSIGKGALVVDCCGTKAGVCAALEPLARARGFRFIGGHPMAGREAFGYEASSAELFHGASMVLTPGPDVDGDTLEQAEGLFYELGFGRMQVCTPEEHDRMIAYTSQLAHVVSSAYVQSDASLNHIGFSAGSFQDMTRVARLYEPMWAELFLNNAEPLAEELDGLIGRLSAFSGAIKAGDREGLLVMLRLGRERRELITGKENKR